MRAWSSFRAAAEELVQATNLRQASSQCVELPVDPSLLGGRSSDWLRF
jgi:hypothetical protein